MKILNSTIALLFVALLWSCGSKTADTDTVDETPKTTFADGTYTVASGSKLMWTGAKTLGSSHNGDISLTSGAFTLEGDKITGGSFVIDMASINNLDLAEDAESKAKLEGHLKTADFFDTEQFPTATITITGSEPVEGNTHKVMGDFTLKGKTNPITFNATVAPADKGAKIAADFTFDRTLWNVEFNSPKFPAFANLAADNVISDDIAIKFDLTATK